MAVCIYNVCHGVVLSLSQFNYGYNSTRWKVDSLSSGGVEGLLDRLLHANEFT